ncbi:uncharacterized protein LOC135371044 [Ornithodoros turicata]|uniref:uncharacterized protein LOC135371044 n=1 Tax=Ornithodoros turicata TaxID=34597 RepID=UPI003138BDC7
MRSQLALGLVFVCYTISFVICGERVEYVDAGKKKEPPKKLRDSKQGVKMGVKSASCDDGRSRLEVDYDGSPIEHTCYTPKEPYPPESEEELPSTMECDKIKGRYSPSHYCMNRRITYDHYLPTHEGHRPLWAVYGEYKYCPPQRWLHNVEHGALVMLYHPCTLPSLVDKLRDIVKSCLRKYIITPYRQLTRERPLALVAWRCRYEMNTVNEKEVKKFIKARAMKAPESHYPRDGYYKFELIEQSSAPPGSDIRDSVVCPKQ